MTRAGGALEIHVLGELELIGDAAAIPLRARKHMQLLAALVIRRGEACSADALIDALWGASPPVSAGKLLQVYVSQLRRLLPAPARIGTRGSGYLLEFDAASLDAARFELLLREGRAALRDGNAALAGSLLRRALGLWRGPAYGELAYEQFARVESERLEELRMVALEERIQADLAAGRHAELVGELRAVAGAHPVRERIQAQAMLCLYRCGRQTEALEVFTAIRARLRDELGLEPGTELRELQRRILQHDPALAASVMEVSPAELPAAPNRLLGRERELQDLRAMILGQEVRLLVLCGAGGSGKTRLALEAARQSAGWFANGVALVALAPLRDPSLVVGAISRAVGIEDQAGDPLERLLDAVRSLELLLVVDNAEHLRAAAPIFVELLASAPRLKLVITSRAVLHLSGEQVYPVGPLDARSASELFLERARAAEPSFRADEADDGKRSR